MDWGDKGEVLAAVAKDGNALFAASVELKADRQVVLVAVAQTGNALRVASVELKADREVVLAAVAQDDVPYVLRFFSEVAHPYPGRITKFILRPPDLNLNCSEWPQSHLWGLILSGNAHRSGPKRLVAYPPPSTDLGTSCSDWFVGVYWPITVIV